MLNQGSNVSRGNATLSPDMPPLPQCLPLEPITLGNQKYTRSGELRRVLGVPLGSATEDHSFGVSHPKPPPPVASEELKHFKESVQDASRKARDRAKLLRESIFKLEKYKEVLTSKKRQRSDLLLNERSSGTNVVKAGIQNHRNPHDVVAQRVEEKAKSGGMNKRVRTSMADVRADGRNPIASRQQVVTEKGGDMLQDVGSGNGRFEEKIRKLPAVGEGWETKNKKKRSVGVVAGRVMTNERDLKRATNPKMNADAKLRSSDTQAFRSKSSAGVGGINKLDAPLEPTASDASAVRSEMESGSIPRDRMAPSEQRVLTKSSNKPNVHDDNLASSPSTMIKAKVSRAPRTGSIMLLDSSLKVHSSSVPPQGLEQASNSNRVSMVGNDHKGQTSAGSSSHGMAKWVGQRPHKNSRSRRANIAAPVANHAEVHTSSQGFPPDFNARMAQANGTIMASSIENNTPKFKRETEGVPSPFAFSESEESGAGDTKPKDKGTDSGEVSLNVTEKVGALHFPSKKSKLPVNDIGDGVRRQGRSGRGPSAARLGAHPVREKLGSLPTGKPIQSLKPASDKSKSKTGRPPSKKLKDRKALARVGPALSGGSVDFTGESDDDREELFAAANAARNAKSIGSSGPFWKKMESIFASVSPDDLSYLKQQLSFAQELDESLSQLLGSAYDVLGVIVDRGPDYSRKRQGVDSNQVKKASLGGTLNMGSLEKSSSLYQRVLSALIEEDESEEFYSQSEGKNMSLHYASDDSHCGSCNLIEIETRDRDRMESEVESKVDSQSHKNFFMDRLPCDRTVASNANRNASFSSSLQSNEHWPGDDDFSHSDVGLASETCSSDVGLLHARELSMPVLSSSDDQYQLMCLDDRLILELQSIGLCPEILPDLADEEEVFNQEMMELRKGLYQQNGVKKKKLDKIDAAIQKGGDAERRITEQVALDQLIEMAYRKRLACRGNQTSKNAVRKVSRQVALGFVKRTIARCRKFEETGVSCFSEPALQEVIFSMPSCNNDTKSMDCVGSGTASNTCNEISNHRAEARASGVISSSFERYGSPSDNFDRGKKREVLIDDVIGSASSRVTSTLDSTVIGGVKGKRSDRERDQNKDNLRSTSVSGASRASVDADGNKNERRTKSKPKQKNTHLSSSANGPRGAPNASNKVDRADAAKEVEEPLDFSQLQLPDFDAIGLGESNDLSGPQDLSNWLNFDEEGLQDHDSVGLEIPMDDLMDLQMLM
ncbi:hypothetical protein Tsubulata_010242 [Turnera subulata]|uniref:Uncharacterized protein n=1 Tax=Turnera subulata TaxID=218843 RepID=A0A9Q0GE54_9ROSI|nr:hypothetical protein Tsubulata_010242 [Turnera subulata]